MFVLLLVIFNIRIEGEFASAFAAQPHYLKVIRMHLPYVNLAINGFKE
jgi:hypothetical protein